MTARAPRRLLRLALALAALPLPAQGVADISLDSLLRTRVSSAARYAQAAADAPAAVTVVTRDDIARYGWRTLDEVLETLRGFYVSDDRNYPGIGVRGFARAGDYNNRVLLLLDGHVTNENIYGSAFGGSDLALDLASVERIEVVRGPGAALYGSGAMLAVINVITRDATQGPSRATLLYGPTETERRVGGRWARSSPEGSTSVVLDALWGDANGRDLRVPEYDRPGAPGIARALDWEQRWNLGLRARRGGWFAHAMANWRDKGIPAGGYAEFGDPRAQTLDVNRFGELRWQGDESARLQPTVRAYLDQYRYRGAYPGAGGSMTRERVESDAVGGEALVRWDIASNHRLVAGTEWRRVATADYASSTDGVSDAQASRPFSLGAAYLQHEWQAGRAFAVLAGLRHDRWSFGPSATTPRVAVVLEPRTGTTLKLNYGQAARAPSIAEYALLQVGFIDNPALRPERITTVEASLTQRFGDRVLATASAYDFGFRDLIEVEEAGAAPAGRAGTPGPDAVLQNRNRARPVRGRGVELGVQARMAWGISGYLNAGAQRADARPTDASDERERLSNSPDVMVASGVSRRTGLWLSALEWRLEGRRLTRDRGLETPRRGVVNLHLALGGPDARGGRWLRDAELSLRVRDLFQSGLQFPAGLEFRQRLIPSRGRTVTLQLTVRP